MAGENPLCMMADGQKGIVYGGFSLLWGSDLMNVRKSCIQLHLPYLSTHASMQLVVSVLNSIAISPQHYYMLQIGATMAFSWKLGHK